jgi:hypothetical protein
MIKMVTEKVFSPYDDKNIDKNLNDSDIWKKAYKEDEITDDVKRQYQFMFLYKIKFNGLTPVQVLNKKMIKFN